MFQVMYEQTQTWPETGSLFVQAPAISAEIRVSPDSARRMVNDYLTMYVSMMLRAINPILILRERPVWRLTMEMRLLKLGPVATLGTVDVDACTCEVIPLSSKKIREIQDRANDIITRLTPETV